METNKFNALKNYPDLLAQISEIVNNPVKYEELESYLKKSGLVFESPTFKTQFAIQSIDDLKYLKKFINDILIPA